MSRVGWIRIAVLVIAIGLLELCCRIGLIDHRVVIPPSEMADALVRLLISGQANEQIVRTFGIVVVAALISVVAGFALGLVIHALPRVLLAEMFAAKQGLGSLIINAMQLLQAEEMITVAVVLFAFAALANALLLWIEHRLHRRV